MEVPDEFRGRVFAAEFALLTFSMAFSNYFTGYVIDFWEWSPRFTGALLGGILLVPAAVWMIIQSFWQEKEE
jgi:heme A synthase